MTLLPMEASGAAGAEGRGWSPVPEATLAKTMGRWTMGGGRCRNCSGPGEAV